MLSFSQFFTDKTLVVEDGILNKDYKLVLEVFSTISTAFTEMSSITERVSSACSGKLSCFQLADIYPVNNPGKCRHVSLLLAFMVK